MYNEQLMYELTYVRAASLVSNARPPNDLDLPSKDLTFARVIAEPDVFGVYRGCVHRWAAVLRVLIFRINRCLQDRPVNVVPPVTEQA